MIRYDFSQVAAKEFLKLSTAAQSRIIKKLEFFLSHNDPWSFATRLSITAPQKTYRFRIGSYRVIFDREKDGILILRVGHRADIYRRQLPT